jgi:hypothetical protein
VVRSCEVSGKVCTGGVDTNYSMGSSPSVRCLAVLVAAVVSGSSVPMKYLWEKTEEMFQEISACVVSISYGWYMVVLTCGWNGVLSGVLAACVLVCAVHVVVSRSLFSPVVAPCVGLFVCRYALWCKIS